MNNFVRVFSVVSLLSLAACSGDGELTLARDPDAPPSGGGVGGVWFGETTSAQNGVNSFFLDLTVRNGSVTGSGDFSNGVCDLEGDFDGTVDSSGVCTGTLNVLNEPVTLSVTMSLDSTGTFILGSVEVQNGPCDGEVLNFNGSRPNGQAFEGEFWGNWESDTQSGELSLTLTQSGSEVEGSASFTNASSCGLGTIVSAEVAKDNVLYGTIGNNVEFRAVIFPATDSVIPNGIGGRLTVTSGACVTGPEEVEIFAQRKPSPLTAPQGGAARPEVDLIVSSEGAEPEVRRGVMRQRNKANLNKFSWPKR